MGRALLVFTGSPGFDVYINSMANAVDQYGVDRIVLINITDLPSADKQDFEEFGNDLQKVIAMLAKGQYEYRGQLYDIGAGIPEYQKLNEIYVGKTGERTIKKVSYSFLKEDILKLKQIYGTDAIVDVSGALKRIAIDILAACLAIDMKCVTLFELRKRPNGVETLYHELKKTGQYDLVILSDEAPLLDNLDIFSAKQNRLRFLVVVASIFISLLLTVLYQWAGITFGAGNWFLVGALVFVGIFGGIIPIVDAGGGHLISLITRRS